MATTTISALTAVLAGNLDDTAVLPVDDKNGNTRKATIPQLRTQLNTGAQVFTADVSVGDDLAVTDDATIGGDLAVTGALTVTALTSTIGVEAWIAPTLGSSWANTGGAEQVAGYYKDPTGRVHLRGTLGGGTINGGNAFTLPVGYRPTKVERFAVAGNDIYTSIKVSADGTVLFDVGSSTRVCMDGVSFLTT